MKRVMTLTIALSMWILSFATAFAEDALATGISLGVTDVKPLHFTLELIKDFSGYSLYGNLSDITGDMVSIVPCYSFDGVSYTPEEYNKWEINADDVDMQRQQCFWPMESPLQDYLSGEVNTFYIKLLITYKDGKTEWTEADSITRDTATKPLPADFQVGVWFDTPIRMIQFRPLKIWGQYNFTVLDTATSQEMMALLPKKIPVEMQVKKAHGQAVHSEVLEYDATWSSDIIIDGTTAVAVASEITAPKDISILVNTDKYKIEDKDLVFGDLQLKATFHRVPANLPSQLLLTADTTLGGLFATLPLKPTGATKIMPEYSLDNGKKWVTLEDVLLNYPPEAAQPKIMSYTLKVLTGDDTPMKAYSEKIIDGFLVRLRIEGGALAGVTQAEKWPADYEYIPPINNSDDQGGTGNNGNIGAGNGGGTDEGQRPKLPNGNTRKDSATTVKQIAQPSANNTVEPVTETDTPTAEDATESVGLDFLPQQMEEPIKEEIGELPLEIIERKSQLQLMPSAVALSVGFAVIAVIITAAARGASLSGLMSKLLGIFKKMLH